MDSALSMPREIWSAIPTEELLSELTKRQHGGAASDGPKPACGSTASAGSYNTPLHVFALFLILILSTCACGLPLITNTSTKSRGQKSFVFYSQHFGTGVLLATAFIHLLPMAFMSLTNPCLPDFFSKLYTPMAGFVAMVSALSVVALESYLTARGAGHVHTHAGMWDDDEEEKVQAGGATEMPLASRRHQHPPAISLEDMDESQGLVEGISPRPGLTPTTPQHASTSKNNTNTNANSDDDSDMDLDINELDPNPTDGPYKPLNGRPGPSRHAAHEPNQPITQEEQSRLFLQCVLLEAGILFHSVFIGMALSVESGPAFVVFLIAICIHQSFEGLALGSRIAAIQLPKRSVKPWLMVLSFGMTTPLGQAIGLIIHNMYDPQSEMGLLMVGFMNAISAGLLLFAGLVQLLAEDFLSDKSYKVLAGKRRVRAFMAVVGGGLLMAAVGAIA